MPLSAWKSLKGIVNSKYCTFYSTRTITAVLYRTLNDQTGSDENTASDDQISTVHEEKVSSFSLLYRTLIALRPRWFRITQWITWSILFN